MVTYTKGVLETFQLPTKKGPKRILYSAIVWEMEQAENISIYQHKNELFEKTSWIYKKSAEKFSVQYNFPNLTKRPNIVIH